MTTPAKPPQPNVSSEALFALLFGRTSTGFGVLSVNRPTREGRLIKERHAFDVTQQAGGWLHATKTAVRYALSMDVWPFACGRSVLRGVGTSAFCPANSTHIRLCQGTVALLWEEEPAAKAVSRFVEAGGHLLRSRSKRIGLLQLAEPQPRPELTHLAAAIGGPLGAGPLGYAASFQLPGTPDAEWLTDPALAVHGQALTSNDLAQAGLVEHRLPRVAS